jgi:pimeloyl-ACP methyl ester carboxylesterase
LARVFLPLMRPLLATRAGRRLLLTGAATRPELVDRRAAAHLIRSYARAPGFTDVNAAMRSGTFDGLDRIDAPVTLVWPEHDTLVRRPRALPDNVTSVTLEHAGHIPMLDFPDEVARVIEQGTGAARSERRSALPPAAR